MIIRYVLIIVIIMMNQFIVIITRMLVIIMLILIKSTSAVRPSELVSRAKAPLESRCLGAES